MVVFSISTEADPLRAVPAHLFPLDALLLAKVTRTDGFVGWVERDCSAPLALGFSHIEPHERRGRRP